MYKYTTDELIRKYVPSVETIEESYIGDEAMILTVCKELDCSRDEIILTRLEVTKLIKHVAKDIPIKITMMDFTNKTIEEALCEVTSQY